MPRSPPQELEVGPRSGSYLLVDVILHSLRLLLLFVFNRPGVAGAVLQSPPSFIESLINSLTDP